MKTFLPQCGTCKWFASVNKEGGTCHLKPPGVFIVPVQTIQGQSIQATAFFPPVRLTDACGEHHPGLNG